MTHSYQPGCEACEIEKEDRLVKQKPRHTCGKDGPNREHLAKEFKREYNQTEPVSSYEAEVRRIAEILGNIYLNFPVFRDREDTPYFNDFVERTIISFLPYARAMVAEMAKVAQDAYQEAEKGECMGCGTYAIERGLIPSPENNNNG